MTIGNVTDYIQMAQQVMAATQVTYGIVTPQVSNAQDFSNLMNRASQNTTDKATVSVEKEQLSTEHKDAYRSKSTIKEKLLSRDKHEPSDDKVSELTKEVKDTLKEALSLNDEQLEELMSELGLTVADLLNPTNVVMLFAKANDVVPGEIVLDANLSESLTGLLEKLDALVENFAAENQIPVESVGDLILKEQSRQITDSDISQEDAVKTTEAQPKTETVVVKDAKTGKEVKVTTENNVTTSQEVTANAKDQRAEDSKNGSGQNQKNSDGQNSAMNQVMDNLTEHLNEALQPNEELGFTQQVNATDVIRQMMDAIKVSATQSIQSMEIQLNPENLGKLNLTVSAKDGIITASITAQNEAVKTALENQMVALKENLSNAGLKVEQVEVTVASHEFESNLMNQNGQNEQQDNARQGARRRFVEFDDDELESTPESILDGESNINVTA